MSGYPPSQGGYSHQVPNVPNYLVQSILVTVFCCLPFGIVAIIYAAQVNGKLAAGDIAGAMAASKSASKWSWIAFGCGLVTIVLSFVLPLLGVSIGAPTSSQY